MRTLRAACSSCRGLVEAFTHLCKRSRRRAPPPKPGPRRTQRAAAASALAVLPPRTGRAWCRGCRAHGLQSARAADHAVKAFLGVGAVRLHVEGWSTWSSVSRRGSVARSVTAFPAQPPWACVQRDRWEQQKQGVVEQQICSTLHSGAARGAGCKAASGPRVRCVRCVDARRGARRDGPPARRAAGRRAGGVASLEVSARAASEPEGAQNGALAWSKEG